MLFTHISIVNISYVGTIWSQFDSKYLPLNIFGDNEQPYKYLLIAMLGLLILSERGWEHLRHDFSGLFNHTPSIYRWV